jgi:hypothetical protein
MMQAKRTGFTTLEHGQNKHGWPMRVNGKNFLNGKTNWMVDDKKMNQLKTLHTQGI